MAVADVNDTQPSRREIIVARLVERVAGIDGMAGATDDKPYVGLRAEDLPFTWVVETDEEYDDQISTEHYDAWLEFVTWTQFHWDESETCRQRGRRILKALLIAIPGLETDPTLGVDDNGAPLVFQILPKTSIIEPSGESGNTGVVKILWRVNYIFLRTDPSAQ